MDVQTDIQTKQTDKSRIGVFRTGTFIVKLFQLHFVIRHQRQQKKTSVAWDDFDVPVSDSSDNPPSGFPTLGTPGTLCSPFELSCLEVTNCFLGLNYFHPCTPPPQVLELQEDVECQNDFFVLCSLQQRCQEAPTNHSLSGLQHTFPTSAGGQTR